MELSWSHKFHYGGVHQDFMYEMEQVWVDYGKWCELFVNKNNSARDYSLMDFIFTRLKIYYTWTTSR